MAFTERLGVGMLSGFDSLAGFAPGHANLPRHTLIERLLRVVQAIAVRGAAVGAAVGVVCVQRGPQGALPVVELWFGLRDG